MKPCTVSAWAVHKAELKLQTLYATSLLEGLIGMNQEIIGWNPLSTHWVDKARGKRIV